MAHGMAIHNFLVNTVLFIFISYGKNLKTASVLAALRTERALKWPKTAFTSPSNVSRSPVLFGR